MVFDFISKKCKFKFEKILVIKKVKKVKRDLIFEESEDVEIEDVFVVFEFVVDEEVEVVFIKDDFEDEDDDQNGSIDLVFFKVDVFLIVFGFDINVIDFVQFNFFERMMKVIEEMGFIKMIEIQRWGILLFFVGKDVLGVVKIGFGKIFVFLIFVIEMLYLLCFKLRNGIGVIVVIFICELVLQIFGVVCELMKYYFQICMFINKD